MKISNHVIVLLFLILFGVVLMSGCTKEPKSMEFGQTVSTASGIELTPINLFAGDTYISPSKGSGDSKVWGWAEKGKDTISVAAKINNRSKTETDLAQMAKMTLLVGNQEYESELWLLDKNAMNFVEKTKIQAGAQRLAYFSFCINERERGKAKALLALGLGSRIATYQLSLDTTKDVLFSKPLKKDKAMTGKDGTIKIKTVSVSKRVNPTKASATAGYYYYYAKKGDVLLDVQMKVKNLRKQPTAPKNIASVQVIGKGLDTKAYVYPEKVDGSDFEKRKTKVKLKQGESRSVHYFSWIDDRYRKKPFIVYIFFGDEVYTYAWKKKG